MKKYMVMCAGLCAALAFTGCKSSESAYRKMYEKAKAQEENRATEQNQGGEEIAVVAPVVEKPASETVVVDNADNVPIRQESLSVVNGAGLKSFSVIVGSFAMQANAEGLQSTLKSQGYDAQVAYNPSNQMYLMKSIHKEDKRRVRHIGSLPSCHLVPYGLGLRGQQPG